MQKIIEKFRKEYDEHENKILERLVFSDRQIARRNFLEQSLKQAIQEERKRIGKKLQDYYGQDGNPALVIMEDVEGGVETRPALNELIKKINE